MISKLCGCRPAWLAALVLVSATTLSAGYKARAWKLKASEAYPARLTSESVTIAAEPLYTDALAAGAFDKSDIVTRGIIPLGIVIFNDNDFPVTVRSDSIEVINGESHLHTLTPEEAVARVFAKSGKSFIPQPFPKIKIDPANNDALEDFDQKFLANKTVAPHGKSGGFLYLRLPGGSDVSRHLAEARVYIPEIIREDTGAKMIFFEIDLKPAVGTTASR